MAFKVKKESKTEMIDKRVGIPAETWAAVDAVAKREGLDPQEVIRQALAYALKKEIKGVKTSDASPAE